ncbi:MAG: hypothetical protein HYY66_00375, partial [Candidatus Tectomicrobia bacterium]|nr:hypothetical protein [Candidatus Tectomicrobia bacterium]
MKKSVLALVAVLALAAAGYAFAQGGMMGGQGWGMMGPGMMGPGMMGPGGMMGGPGGGMMRMMNECANEGARMMEAAPVSFE